METCTYCTGETVENGVCRNCGKPQEGGVTEVPVEEVVPAPSEEATVEVTDENN